MTPLWERVEADLEELNDLASQQLVKHPAPDGLPPIGTWVRVYLVDMDARPIWQGPWHFYVGWDGRWGSCRTRCMSHARVINRALGVSYSYRPANLDVSAERPEADRCRSCDKLLAHDKEKVPA